MKKITALITIFITLSVIFYSLPAQAQQSQLVTITPNNADLKVNEEKVVAIQLNSEARISGFDLKFNTSGPVNIVDFENSLVFESGFDPFNVRQVTEKIEGNSARIAYILNGAESNLPQRTTLYFKVGGSSNGQGKVDLDYNNSQVLDGKGNLLQVPPLSATYNLNSNQSSNTFINPDQIPQSEYPESAAVVNIKVKLFGANTNINNKIKATAVAVGRIGEGPYETQPQEFTLSANPDNTFSGKFAFPNFRDGNKFSLMIKADKYLLKRICNADASENKAGAYKCTEPSLTIRSGEEANFDFSGISLVPGDLGLFDGYLNGYDLSLVRNNQGKNDPESLGTADLNYDNIVNEKDFEIINFVALNTNRKADQ